MAEKLKQFVNKTLNEFDFDINGKHVLISNDATTQAVIKDVSVNNPLGLTGSFDNDGHSILSVDSATGYELVDVGNELSLTLNPTPANYIATSIFSEIYYTKDGTKLVCHNILEGAFPIKGTPIVSEGSTIMSGISHSFSSNTRSFYKNKNGVLFQINDDGNSSQQLYRSTDNGASWTVISSGFSVFSSYCPMIMVGNLCYWINGATLYNYDMDMQTQGSSISFGAQAAGASYPFLCHANGFFFASYNAQGSAWFYKNPITGASGQINNLIEGGSGKSHAVHYYNGDYYFLTRLNNALSCRKITGSPSNSISATFLFSTDSVFSNSLSNTPVAIGRNIYLFKTNYKLAKIDLLTGAVSDEGLIVDNNAFLQLGRNVLPKTITDFDIDIGVKISGVEITGVN